MSPALLRMFLLPEIDTMRSLLFLLCLTPFVWSSPVATAAEPFSFRDGDRVVMLGGTFIEREGQFGVIETALTAAISQKDVTFRNLGWSGDTVWAESRGIFDAPAVGYQRMLDLVKELKPTVILLAYGQNEAFAGPDKLPEFLAQYEKLCDDLSVTQARLVFLTPHLFEKPAAPLSDASRWNSNLELYSHAIVKLAAQRNAAVVDLTGVSLQGATTNGIHLTTEGYQRLAEAISKQLCGHYLGATAKTEAIRQKVIEKNTLFFHRWRPQNITYLTGFRKHEQGNNAVEIAQFDPLVQQKEQEIAQLKHSK